jgi:hypothetical protein
VVEGKGSDLSGLGGPSAKGTSRKAAPATSEGKSSSAGSDITGVDEDKKKREKAPAP